MKIMTCFIDTSAWLAIVDAQHEHHPQAVDYFRELLENNAKIVSNNIAIDKALIQINHRLGLKAARDFWKIIDESILTINLRMDWISRRVRRNAIAHYLKKTSEEMQLEHYFLLETVKRKKVDILFTFDDNLRHLGLPVMPQSGERL